MIRWEKDAISNKQNIRIPVDRKSVDRINSEFASLQSKGKRIVPDGILNLEKYNSAETRIMWILKQDIEFGQEDYFSHLKENIRFIKSSPTWRRIAYTSTGILHPRMPYEKIQQLSREQLFNVMLHTAVVNLDKEPGNSCSPNDLILDGFKRYRSIVSQQISVYAPDIIIIGLPEELNSIVDDVYCLFTGKIFHFSIPNIKSGGADVAVVCDDNKLFLWTYHPSCRKGAEGMGVTDKDYVQTLIEGALYLNLRHK